MAAWLGSESLLAWSVEEDRDRLFVVLAAGFKSLVLMRYSLSELL